MTSVGKPPGVDPLSITIYDAPRSSWVASNRLCPITVQPALAAVNVSEVGPDGIERLSSILRPVALVAGGQLAARKLGSEPAVGAVAGLFNLVGPIRSGTGGRALAFDPDKHRTPEEKGQAPIEHPRIGPR
jgi:hypothetical protein